jgi:hypothetical protein
LSVKIKNLYALPAKQARISCPILCKGLKIPKGYSEAVNEEGQITQQ